MKAVRTNSRSTTRVGSNTIVQTRQHFRTETTIGTFFMGQNVFSVISRMTSAGIRVRNGAVLRVGRKSNLVGEGLASPSTWRPNNFGYFFRVLLVVLFSGLLRQSLAQ